MKLEIESVPPICECCNRYVRKTTVRKAMSATLNICDDCFEMWHDGGLKNTGDIPAAVIKKHGYHGGEANLTQDLLVHMFLQGLIPIKEPEK